MAKGATGEKDHLGGGQAKARHASHICYNLIPGRPDKAGAKIDNNCCRVDLSREHIGSLLLDQWVKDKHVKGCIGLEVCKLTRKGSKDPT
jgi:hypothetical protein